MWYGHIPHEKEAANAWICEKERRTRAQSTGAQQDSTGERPGQHTCVYTIQSDMRVLGMEMSVQDQRKRRRANQQATRWGYGLPRSVLLDSVPPDLGSITRRYTYKYVTLFFSFSGDDRWDPDDVRDVLWLDAGIALKMASFSDWLLFALADRLLLMRLLQNKVRGHSSVI